MNRRHCRWPAWLLFCGTYVAGCGGHSTGATSAVCADRSSDCGVDDPQSAATNCQDVRFVKAPADGTGVVACATTGYPPDLYSTRAEACNDRGIGNVAVGAPIPCSSDSECPSDATCGDNKVCYLAPDCDGDSDCGAGNACICAGVVGVSAAVAYNQCVPAECRSDADCGGYSCTASNVDPCGSLGGLYCHTERDECARHSDCGDRLCAFDTSARAWRCTDSSRICDEFL